MLILGLVNSHDSSAALLSDGSLVAAVEEERLNREKHSSDWPVRAVEFCLSQVQAAIEDVECIAVGQDPSTWADVKRHYLEPTGNPLNIGASWEEVVVGLLCGKSRPELAKKVEFIDHHQAHAMSTYLGSGFGDSLVVTLDGVGDCVSGTVWSSTAGDIVCLDRFSQDQSLGYLYRVITEFLGYEFTDAYKVMGLAPYGDPDNLAHVFRRHYELAKHGSYTLEADEIARDLAKEIPPRRSGSEFSSIYRDVAATLQHTIETIAMHYIGHFHRKTGLRSLCLAGGVAHNCTLNGKLAAKGWFDRIYVQAASSDAGLSVGAAMFAHLKRTGYAPEPMTHVFLGPTIGEDDQVVDVLSKWQSVISFERCDDICDVAADLLANDKVLGWVQGRSEFGPRALGNRCILADPRPAENKNRINAMVKKREAYRPFAPSVLAENIDEYFSMPGTIRDFPFMSFVLEVRKEKQGLLGAVTHVDGSARVQSVNRDFNRMFWQLIYAFGQRTGVPMLLNTSFNNHREPIVNTIEEVIGCFLTTELDFLVIGSYLISKRTLTEETLSPLYVALLPKTKLVWSGGEGTCTFDAPFCHQSLRLSEETALFEMMMRTANGQRTIGACTDKYGIQSFVQHLREWWSERLITVSASPINGKHYNALTRAGLRPLPGEF